MAGGRLQEFVIAIGLFFVLEGLIYAALPGGIKRMAQELPSIPDHTLRTVGTIVMALGVLIVWFVKS